jgi:hypothetical protein
MTLSLEEARSLAGLFGELDRKKMLLLLLFDKPGSKWDKKEEIKKLPKSDRISTATLYRNVDEMKAGGFLEEVKGAERRGRSGTEVLTYCLTFKGYLAEAIIAHLLLLEQETSADLRKKIRKIVEDLDSSPGWPLYIEFLNYHRQRKIDLSPVNVDGAYFTSMLWLALTEHSEDAVWERLQPSIKKLGLDSLVTKEAVADFKNYFSEIRSFSESFLAEMSKRSVKTGAKEAVPTVRRSGRNKQN